LSVDESRPGDNFPSRLQTPARSPLKRQHLASGTRRSCALIEVTVGAGTAGELDRFFMSREEEIVSRASGLLELADQHICFLAEEVSGLTSAFLPGSAEPILERVRRFVLKHPFYPDLLPHLPE